MDEIVSPLRVGDVLYGFCGGHFRDSYSPKRVEAIGADWIVVRDEDGRALMAEAHPEDLIEYRTPEDH